PLNMQIVDDQSLISYAVFCLKKKKYDRRIFNRYAINSRAAIALLDELFDSPFRVVPVSREHTLELLEFEEIGALVSYVGDLKTREAIVDRVALMTTQ